MKSSEYIERAVKASRAGKPSAIATNLKSGDQSLDRRP